MCETDQVNSRALDRIRHECIFHPKIIRDKWWQTSKFSYLYQYVAISIPVLHIYKRIEMSLNSIANDYRKAMNRPKDRKKQHNSKKTWRLFSGFSCARWSKQYNAFKLRDEERKKGARKCISGTRICQNKAEKCTLTNTHDIKWVIKNYTNIRTELTMTRFQRNFCLNGQ